MILTIELPWPSRTLSPNARPHWAALARAKKVARLTGQRITQEALEGREFPKAEKVKLTWTFCLPSRRRYDRDNLIASCKAFQDGIADALKIDDSKFECEYKFGVALKGGSVFVKIGS